jgi:hypothetical protein
VRVFVPAKQVLDTGARGRQPHAQCDCVLRDETDALEEGRMRVSEVPAGGKRTSAREEEFNPLLRSGVIRE